MTSPMAEAVVRKAYEDLVLRDCFAISNAYTAVQSGVCIGAYIGLAWIGLQLDSIVAWLILWPLQSFIMAGFLGASHDCAHRVHYTNPLANRIAGMFWATITSVNFTLYKHFHLDHHQFVGTDDDTEPAGEFDSLYSYLVSMPTVYFFYTFWRMSGSALRGRFPHFIRNREQRRNVLLDDLALLAWFGAIALCVFFWPKQVLVTYLVPLVSFFPTVFLFSLPEHYGCDHSTDWQRNTRTITSHPLVSYFYWYGNYHADHHVFPRIPSRFLPAAHAVLKREFAFVSKSYAMFHITLMRKLWSPAATESFEAGVQKILSPSERIHFKELLANESPSEELKE